MIPNRVPITAHGNVAVATLEGEIDIANAHVVSEQLLRAAADHPLGLIGDLSTLRYLDSGGVRMLFQVAEQLATSRRRLGLVVPDSSPLHRLVKITGLGEAATVAATLDDCLRAMRPPDAGAG